MLSWLSVGGVREGEGSKEGELCPIGGGGMTGGEELEGEEDGDVGDMA